jgi:hypothetical protein
MTLITAITARTLIILIHSHSISSSSVIDGYVTLSTLVTLSVTLSTLVTLSVARALFLTKGGSGSVGRLLVDLGLKLPLGLLQALH